MSPDLVKNIVEAALFAANEPLGIDRLLALFDESERPEKDTILNAIQIIQEDYAPRAVELREVANGYRFQVKTDIAAWVSRLWDEKPAKYSRALLETLALIAYRQPITRGEIEEIRGVAVSTQIIKTLQERDWIRVVGHRDVPGRPSLYATTKNLLDYFGLKSLEDLPPLSEIKDLNQIDLEVEQLGEQSEIERMAQQIREHEFDATLPDEATAANDEIVAEETPSLVTTSSSTDELLPDLADITDVVELDEFEIRDNRIDNDLVQTELSEENSESLLEQTEDELEEELATNGSTDN